MVIVINNNNFQHRIILCRPTKIDVLKRNHGSGIKGVLQKVTRGVSNAFFSSKSTHDRGYATYKACKAEATTTKPQSLYNNPPIPKKSGGTLRHREVHRERCIEDNCSKKICSSLCDDFQDRKAVGHFTHGQTPPPEPNKTFIPKVSQTDMDGNNKPESLVIYHNAHETSSTAEIVNGTIRINKDQDISNAIIKHADTK